MKKLLFITLLIAIVGNIGIIQTGDATMIEPIEIQTTSTEDVLDIVEEEIKVEEPFEELEEPEEVIDCIKYDIPDNRGFKSYMDYRAITNTNSQQFKLQNLYTNTGELGIRMVNDRYCIAVGTHFDAEIGQYLDLVLENGTVIHCVLADVKADIHTDSSNIVTLHNGCVSEFVVDTQSLYKVAKRMGDVSYCYDEWMSPVTQIVVYEQNVFDQ